MVAKKTNGKIVSGEMRNPAPATAVHPAFDTATKMAPALSSAGKSLTAAQKTEMKRLGIEFSEEVDQRHLKIMFWGATSSRKTETVLRFFPNVLVIDAEGNTDQCVRNKAIPPFQRVKTTDTRKALEVIDAVAAGLIRMPNGDPIQTICIDSVSVLWGVQQEVAGSLAEQRAARYKKDLDQAGTTPLDWGKAKRPLKSLMNRFSKTAVPFLVLIAREKDLFVEMPDGSLKKMGVVPNAVKDTEYDMNLALHLLFDETKRWGYEVTKVQGSLADLFPLGGRGTALPLEKLFEYAAKLKPEAQEIDNGEGDDLAERIANSIMEEVEHTQANLIKYATSKGFTAADLGPILKEKGFKGFDPSRWDEMIRAVDQAAKTE